MHATSLSNPITRFRFQRELGQEVPYSRGWRGRPLKDRATTRGLEEQQTTDGPQAEKGKPGECTQPDISDPQHGQLATPLDGPGLSVDPRLTCPPTS